MVESVESDKVLNIDEASTSTIAPLSTSKKQPKRGILYLSTIPPYMNVTKIREVFGEYGQLGRIYLQLNNNGVTNKKADEKTKSRKQVAKKFTEGWVEFERKSIAKRVAELLNSKQVSTRKKSKQYDCIWNIKYLSNFKWTHLHERLAYERAARKQKLSAEIQLAKKKTNFFTSNLNKKKNNGNDLERNKTESKQTDKKITKKDKSETNRDEFLTSLFN